MSHVSEPEPQWQPALPPGQRLVPSLPVLHYGPVPKFRPTTWRLTVNGATSDGAEHHLDVDAFAQLPHEQVAGDMHCVTRWTALDQQWGGVLGYLSERLCQLYRESLVGDIKL